MRLKIVQRIDQRIGIQLFAFACRVASNHRQKAVVRREGTELPAEIASELPDPERALESAGRAERVHRVLARMDYDRCVALVMHDLDGLTAPEIASALGVPLNTVYSRVRLARAEFRELAARSFPEGGVS